MEILNLEMLIPTVSFQSWNITYWKLR